MMHEHGKSDRRVVPAKPPNKGVGESSKGGLVRSRRKRWREDAWPRAIRTSEPCSGRSAGSACHHNWSGYVKLQVEIGRCGSLRSFITSIALRP
jgi:hypothetical protein